MVEVVTVSFRIVTDLPVPPERAFALSLDVGAHERSLRRTGERIVGGVASGRIRLGETVTFRARHLGVVWRLTSRITALDEPQRFVDEQVRGPFAAFRHEHRFEATVDGAGCRMTDVVVFRAPLGPLGRIVERLVLGRHMERIIRERNTSLAAELRAGA
ncbi:MAG: SRPBCC family protein [Williamsia herbipolensis]|nr:SRPBCC family protein [Williamsia herbipolensis]